MGNINMAVMLEDLAYTEWLANCVPLLFLKNPILYYCLVSCLTKGKNFDILLLENSGTEVLG